MIPAGFDYLRATSVDQALALLQEHGDDAKLLAGGHSLIPAMKLRLSEPTKLIDIGRLEELNYIKEENGQICIGAGVTHRALETSELIQAKAPLLAQAAGVIGDPQVRNRGTLGGSLAHADPAADYPAGVLASEAQIHVKGPDGARTIAADEYFVDLFLTSLQPDELLTEIRVPTLAANTGSAYIKFPHPASRFAVVGCAALVTVDGGTCSQVRLGVTGAANVAFRDTGVEEVLTGQAANAAAIAAAVANVGDGAELLGDAFADEEYRGHLLKVYAKRALMQAVGLG